jgi:hypothetical protein
MNPEKIVSAQVILVAADGARPGPHTRITAENIRDWLPSDEVVTRVSAALRGMGFEVGQCIANSFSITGAVKIFESSFRTKLRELGEGLQFANDVELAAERIPTALRAQIAAITFTRPPDFGPGAASSFM